MKFIHLTDLHLVKPGDRLFNLDPLERLDRCLGDIQTLHEDAAFCVISGDLADKGDATPTPPYVKDWCAFRSGRF